MKKVDVASDPEVSTDCAKPQGRTQYITKLPSSALLGHSVTGAFNSYASVALLKVKEGEHANVVAKIVEAAANLPSEITWLLLKYQEDPNQFMLTETAIPSDAGITTPRQNGLTEIEKQALKEATVTTPDASAQIQPSSSVTTVASTPYASTPQRLASGILTCEKDDSFATLLSTLKEMLVTPSRTTHRRILQAASFETLMEKSTFVEIEKFKVKPGEENEVLQIVTSVLQDIIPEQHLNNISIELQEDCSDPRLFTILYHCLSAKVCQDLHFCNGWARWRRSLAPILDGQALRVKFLGVYHSRHGKILSMDSPVIMAQLDDNKTDGLYTECKTEAVSNPLEAFADILTDRYNNYVELKESLTTAVEGRNAGSLLEFAKSYNHFGFHRVQEYGSTHQSGFIYRDWLPNAKQVALKGDFNNWSTESHRMTLEDVNEWGEGVWSIFIPDTLSGESLLVHGSKVKLHLETKDGAVVDRVPPWSKYTTKSEKEATYDGVVWNPEKPYEFTNSRPKPPKSLKIYEAHIGSCTSFQVVSTYDDMRKTVLPRVALLGYNTLLLVGVQEHNYYPSMGWHVTSFFAPTSRCGEPEDLMRLIDAAHELNIMVFISLVHSHASPAVCDGLFQLDGPEAPGCYFRRDDSVQQTEWDAKIFDYENPNVLRFLLGNIMHWRDEYQIDGIRFEGVTSMIYKHHGINRSWSCDEMFDCSNYFNFDLDEQATQYLMLANDLLQSSSPSVITIASERSSLPTLCKPVDEGGVGFQYRARQEHSAAWIQYTLQSDEDVSMKTIIDMLEHRRDAERTVVCTENYDTTLRARRPLKIAMFAWESLLTHAVGGVSPHVTELSAGLSRLGHEVHVYVRATGTSSAHSIHYGVHYHECTFDLSSDFVQEILNMCNSFVAHMKSTEDFMHEKFAICHAHDWLAAKAAITCAREGRIVIQTIHSTEYGRCGNVAFGGESKRISNIEAEACAVATRVICVSGVLAEEVTRLYGVHPAKIRVVYNGIIANQFDGIEDSGQVKERYGISAMDPLFLFVGRMVVQKGPDLLVEAIPDILRCRAEAKFILVGDGHMLQGLRKRVDELNIGHACRIIGSLSGPPLKSLFKACDAVVVPSRNEPFGIVVLEAWSAYKPVVATTCGGPRDFVSPEVDGYLVDPTTNSVVWGCCKILENFEHARWMGSRGRVKAAFSFSWDTVANQTRDLYFEHLARHDAAYGVAARGDSTLASRLLRESIFDHMTVLDDDPNVCRGLALHKMMRLATIGLGGDAYQNTMGNEFGQPEFVDMPRMCNNFSYHHARTRWDLADDIELKFKFFQLFDACMNHLEEALQWLASPHHYISTCSDEDKVVAFERGGCLFIFNFHPHNSYEGYTIGHSLNVDDLIVVLDTDEDRFGGYNRVSHDAAIIPNLGITHHGRDDSVKLYLPNRTGMVLISAKLLELVDKQPKDFLTADAFINHIYKPSLLPYAI